MFLDPEPKRPKTSSNANMSTPGFFSSQRPIASPRDQPNRTRRKALHQRSKSQQNEQQQQQQQQLSHVPEQATVRLVNPSPSPPSTTSSHQSRSDADERKENWQQNHGALPRLPQSAWVKGASVSNSSISAAGRDYGVSETPTPANEAQRVDNAPNITLLPNNSQHELSRPTWHRLSTSSGYSQASTLHESEIASSKKSGKSQRFSSFSQISTLRGTPTPTEEENRERAAEGEVAARSGSGSALALEALQETSPERPQRLSTIRPVPPSDTSSSPTQQGPGSQSADDSPTRPRTAPSSDLEQSSPVLRHRTSRTYSTGSIPSPPSSLNTRDITTTPVSHLPQDSPESRAISEATFPPQSSPNFIAYSPDSVRPISREDPIRSATSIDSINSRLRYGPIGRPETGRSQATNSSWASSDSNDPLPPLHIPKKRLRHKAASESLSTQASTQASSSHAAVPMAEEEEIDTLPYPKRPFSSHLSTIASESEQSRTASQHLSHFSLGSGVLTGDDASSLPLSPVGHRRTGSAPAESIGSNLGSPGTRGTSSSEFQEEAGDMTLGIYREQSAVPQPLFRAQGAPNLLDTTHTRKYDGPLPPIPPIPKSRDSNEDFDTLSALQSPGLKQKRSGYSLRQRSNSTPSHSRQQSQVSCVESERFSQGSSLFPTWARNFYSGTHGLRSKVSLGSMSTASQRPPMHRRNPSSWTERSITSRLGTGYSNVESSSPTSSHFLPAIFRPRTRKRQNSQRDSRSSKVRKSVPKRSQDSRRDSMAIHQDPLPQSQEPLAGPSDDVLPSGQPRWGKLKGSETSSPEPGRRLPRKYSKQRLWDTMEFPRPMTKDRLSDFNLDPASSQQPRLTPSKRTSQNRLSAWQAPSFVSSLDTLITSRCNRQILLFAMGFVCPLMWMLGALLPLPKKPMSPNELEKGLADSQDDVAAAMMKHEAGDAERRWMEEKTFLKARWWRMLNRVMSVVGVLVIGAVIALAVVATT